LKINHFGIVKVVRASVTMNGATEGDAVEIEDNTSKGRVNGKIGRVSEGETVGERVDILEIEGG
jgi:ribosomal protein S6E (S10)